MKIDKIESAICRRKEGFNCAQATLAAYAKELGLEVEVALKVAGAFGAGMARMGDTCGAVTGAFMVLGFKYSQIKANDKDAKERTYKIAQEFVSEFKKRNNCISCKELLGYDISTPEGRQLIEQKDLHNALCSKFIKDAIEIVDSIFTNN